MGSHMQLLFIPTQLLARSTLRLLTRRKPTLQWWKRSFVWQCDPPVKESFCDGMSLPATESYILTSGDGFLLWWNGPSCNGIPPSNRPPSVPLLYFAQEAGLATFQGRNGPFCVAIYPHAKESYLPAKEWSVHNSRQILLRFPQACSLPRHSQVSPPFPRYRRLFLAIVRTTCPLRISKATSWRHLCKDFHIFGLIKGANKNNTLLLASTWVKGKYIYVFM